MRRFLLLLLISLCCTSLHAQPTDALAKGAEARAHMLEAFGGKEAIKKVRTFSYNLTKTFEGDSAVTNYFLDLQKRHITVTSQTPDGVETKSIDASGAWRSINGQKQALSQQEQDALLRTFFYNFIPMLQNEQLVFSYLSNDSYRGRPVNIVRVTDPQQEHLKLDLFIDQENGQVVTSSKEDAEGVYPYYADELEYISVGKGVIFPLVYRIIVDGKVNSQGRFDEIEIKN